MLINDIHLAQLNSSVRNIKARVELLRGSTLEQICNCHDILAGLTIERTGEGKFFGFGICQKVKVLLLDPDRALNVDKENTLDVSFGVGCDFAYPLPRFYVQEALRNEDDNSIEVIAYDILYKAEAYKVSDLNLPTSYTLKFITAACAGILNVPLRFINVDESMFETLYPQGGNFDGTESVRAVLNAIAEATQTIYYINNQWELVFRRLDQTAEPDYTIPKADYLAFKSGEGRTITKIAHATELGDNTSSIGTDEGITQFVRDNPFWELREDIADLLTHAQSNIGGLTIYQFDAEWFGNYLLEIGDKIGLTTRNDNVIHSFLLDDTISFDGGMSQITRWAYDENEGETFTNPVSIGDAVNQTYARVDKVNKRIDLVVSDVDGRMSSIEMTTEDITARVQDTENTVASIQITANGIDNRVEAVEDLVDDVSGDVLDLTKVVETKMTSESFQIEINKILDDGVKKVDTGTGFTFNEDGLTIQKVIDGEEGVMKTLITENGMTVFYENDEVLKANDQGVYAKNLHATTWLNVGRSRITNYKENRTGCFWIGE